MPYKRHRHPTPRAKIQAPGENRTAVQNSWPTTRRGPVVDFAGDRERAHGALRGTRDLEFQAEGRANGKKAAARKGRGCRAANPPYTFSMLNWRKEGE